MSSISKTATLAAVSLVLAGAYWQHSRQSQPEKPSITIGFIAPLTGEAAVYGEPARNIVNLAVEQINASGGINGQTLNVVYEDGRCSGKDAAAAMQKLVSIDHVQAVIGGYCSGESLAAVPIATNNKVVLFSVGSASPKLTGISPYFVRDYPSSAAQGAILAQASIRKGFKKVAFIEEQTDYAQGIYESFRPAFNSPGESLVKEDFPSGTADFRTQLLRLQTESPDALFINTQAPASAQHIVKQLDELNWHPSLILNDTVGTDSAALASLGTSAEGALTAFFDPDRTSPAFTSLLAAYKKKYGTELTYQALAPSEYDGVRLLAQGIDAVGNDGSKLATWLHQVKDWPGTSGPLTITKQGDPELPYGAKIIVNGKPEPYL